MTDSPHEDPTNIALTLTGLRDLYFHLGQIAKVATDQRDELKPLIMAMMGDDKEVMTPDGWMFKIEERQTFEYDKTQLRLVFDNDQMDVVMKPDAKAIDKLAKELDIPAEKMRVLENGKKLISTTKALKLAPPTKETMGLIRK